MADETVIISSPGLVTWGSGTFGDGSYGGQELSLGLLQGTSTTTADADIFVTGIGLNLTVANNIILTEPQWNNAIERQAIDRVYRIGQLKPVNVYILLLNNSIENWINSIKTHKNVLYNIINGDIDKNMLFDTELTKKNNYHKYVGGIS